MKKNYTLPQMDADFKEAKQHWYCDLAMIFW